MNKTKTFLVNSIVFMVGIIVLFTVAITLAASRSNYKIQTENTDFISSSEVVSEEVTTPTTVTTTTPKPTTTTTTTITTTKKTTPKPTTTTTTKKTTTKTTKPTTTTSVNGATTVTTTTAAVQKVTTTTAPVIPAVIDEYRIATVKVTVSAVNVRSAGSTLASILGSASNGTKLEVIGFTTDSSGNEWYAVKYKNQTGFVDTGCVELVKNAGTAYLTFDDGPSKNTETILTVLDNFRVKATFFVKYNKGVDGIYKQIAQRGHTIANHTYSHDYKTIYSSDEAFIADLEKMENFISATAGTSSKIMRFPGAASNTVSKKYNKGIITRLSKTLCEKGYIYFDWNVDSGDANGATVAKNTIINNVKRGVGVKNQVVILMHDSSSKTTTAAALPEIIVYLKNRGYTISAITRSTPPVHHSIAN